jgi:hypothetical protein
MNGLFLEVNVNYKSTWCHAWEAGGLMVLQSWLVPLRRDGEEEPEVFPCSGFRLGGQDGENAQVDRCALCCSRRKPCVGYLLAWEGKCTWMCDCLLITLGAILHATLQKSLFPNSGLLWIEQGVSRALARFMTSELLRKVWQLCWEIQFCFLACLKKMPQAGHSGTYL